MTNQTTAADLRGQFDRLRAACERAGLTPYRNPELTASALVLIMGSKTYGNTFRVYYRDERGGLIEPRFGSFLGWTKREAFDTLHAFTRGIEAVTEQADAARDEVTA